MGEEINAFGNKIETHDDGSMTITTKSGASYNIDADGNTTINLETIKGVGIQNLVDVKSYTQTRSDGFTTHSVEFLDGGTCSFGYSDQGKLMEFKGHNLSQTITPDGYVTLVSATASKKRRANEAD